MLSLIRPSLAGTLLMALTSCGGDPESSDSDDSGGGSGSGGSGEPGSSGGSGTGAAGSGGDVGASTGGGSGSTAGTELSGPVPISDPDFVASVSDYQSSETRLSVWRRYKDAVPLKEETCKTQVAGGCAIFSCSSEDFVGSPDPNGFGADFVDAGAVNVSVENGGTEFNAQIIPDESGAVFGANLMPTGGTLLGGERLTYSLSGEDIPALTRTIPFPARLTTTTAGSVDGDKLIIQADRSAGLTLEWQGGAAGVLYQVSGGEPLLYCEFDSTLGSGEISSDLLKQLAPGARLATLTASAWRGTSGGYQISLATGAETVDPTGLRVYLDVF